MGGGVKETDLTSTCKKILQAHLLQHLLPHLSPQHDDNDGHQDEDDGHQATDQNAGVTVIYFVGGVILWGGKR